MHLVYRVLILVLFFFNRNDIIDCVLFYAGPYNGQMCTLVYSYEGSALSV